MPYIGNTIRAADDYRLIDDISSGFNGSTTSFALQVAGSAPVPFPKSPQQVLISVNGVIQEPDPTGASGFNLVGTNIVFSSAPTNGHAFFGIIYATADYLNAGGNFPSGSTGAPSITFIGDEDTGIYRKGSGSVGFVSNSTEIANTDSNGITISSGNLILGDSSGSSSDRVVVGAGSDLQIYHDGSNSYITEGGTGDLYIQGSAIILEATNGENYFKGLANGAAQVYYDGVSKLQTTSAGITVSDKAQVQGASGDTELILKRTNTAGSNGNAFGSIKFTDSSNNPIGRISTIRSTAADDGDIRFEARPTGGSLTEYLRIKSTGNVQIPVDNSKLEIGAGGDLQLYHDGTNSRIHSPSHNLYIRTGGIFGVFNSAGSEDCLKATVDGAVELFFDNSKKIETTSAGITVTGNILPDANNTRNIGNGTTNFNAIWASTRFRGNDNVSLQLGNSVDFKILHDGTTNLIESPTGADLHIKMMGNSMDTADQVSAKFIEDGAVELYHNGTKKFETTADGILTQGTILHRGAEGIAAQIRLEADEGDDNADKFRLITQTDGTFDIQNNASGSYEINISAIGNGAAELYYDNSKKFETNSSGAQIFSSLEVGNTSAPYLIESTTSGNGLEDIGRVGMNRTNSSTSDRQMWLQFTVGASSSQAAFQARSANDTGTAGTYLKVDAVNNNVDLPRDNEKLQLGAGNDLQLYHNGTRSEIINNTGDLIIQASANNELMLRAQTGESHFIGYHNGKVELYYDGSKKFETVTDGALITRELRVVGTAVNDFESGRVRFTEDGSQMLGGYVHYDGASNILKIGTHPQTDSTVSNDVDAIEMNRTSGSNNVELNYNGDKKFETLSNGARCTGELNSSIKISVGSTGIQASNVASFKGSVSNQVNIARSANSSWGLLLTNSVPSSGYHSTTNSGTGEPCAVVNVNNDALHFGTNNTARWTIYHDGHFIPFSNDSFDIGNTSNRVRNIYTNDLHLSNEGSSNDVDGTWGSYTIQEGSEDLFLINKRNGKKYKFALMEVS